MKSIFLSLITLSILLSSPAHADSARKSSWGKNSAKNYAIKYAINNNPAYITFANDCTNFVSQILRAGGWKDTKTRVSTQDSSWYYTNGKTYSQTWSTSHGLRNRLKNGYEKGATQLSRSFMGIGGSYLNSKVDIGDIVFADWGGDGRFDHAMSVVSKKCSLSL